MAPSHQYAFGDFVLEPSQQRVRRRDGSSLVLTPRLFSALVLFVENAGALLDKDSLMKALWPGVVVEENSLSQVISGLRRALADDSNHSRYIQTVPRRGFRFIAPVTELPDPAASTPPAGPAIGSQTPRSAHGIGPDRRRLLRLALATGAATALGGVGWYILRRASAPAAPR